MEAAAGTQRKLKIFVSYSRKDLEFTKRLCEALEKRGLSTTIDTRDLPKLEDWRRELLGFIRQNDAVVFVLSPHSVTSQVCAWEVEQATLLNKRMAPIVLTPVTDDLVPPALAKINYLDFTDPGAFENQADVLANALSTNLEWLKEHTRLGEASRRWDEDGRPKIRLLRGADIDTAEVWASRRPVSAPTLTETTQSFIEESRRESNLQVRRSRIRSRIVTAVSLAVAVVIGALGWFYYLQWQDGQRALAQARYRQGQWTAREHQSEQAVGYFADSIRVDPSSERARVALYNQLAQNWHLHSHNRIEVGQAVRTLAYGNGAELLVTTDFEVLLFRSDETHDPALTLKHDEFVRSAVVDSSGKRLLTTATTFGSIVEAPYGVVRLWDTSSGQLLASKKFDGVVASAVFAPNGAIVVSTAFSPIVLSASLDREIVDLRGSLDLDRHQVRNAPTFLRLSSDGKLLLWGSGQMAPSFYVWRLEDQKLLYKRALEIPFKDLRFVLGNSKVAMAGPDESLLGGIGSPRVGFVAVQGELDEEPEPIAHANNALLSVAEYDPSGTFLVTAFDDKSVRTFNLRNGAVLEHVYQPAVVTAAAFSPDGLMIGVGDGEGRVRIFDTLKLRPPSALRAQGGPITAVAFSPTQPRMATASEDGSIAVWDTSSTVADQIVLETGQPRMRETTPLNDSGSRLLIRSDDRLELWDALAARQLAELAMNTDELRLAAVSERAGRALLIGEEQPLLLAFDDNAITRLPTALPDGAIMGEFDAAGNRVLIVSKDEVQVLESSTGVSVLKIPREGSADAFYSARFLDEGGRLLVVQGSGLAIWDVKNGRQQQSRKHFATQPERTLKDNEFVTTDAPLMAIDAKVAGDRVLVAFGYEGANVLAPAYRPNQVLTGAQLWSLPAFEPLGQPIETGGGEINSVSLSRSGRLLVAASQDRAVVISAQNGSAVRTVSTDFPVFQSVISPGEDFVALHGRGNDILLINLHDKDAPPRRLIHEGSVIFAEFFNGGSVLVSVAKDGRARLWDVHDGTVIGSEIALGDCDNAQMARNAELLITHMDVGVIAIRRLAMPAFSADELMSFVDAAEKTIGLRVSANGELTATARDTSFDEVASPNSRVLEWFTQMPDRRAVFPGAELTRADVLERYGKDENLDEPALLMALLHQSPNNPQLLWRLADTIERSDRDATLANLVELWKRRAEATRGPPGQ